MTTLTSLMHELAQVNTAFYGDCGAILETVSNLTQVDEQTITFTYRVVNETMDILTQDETLEVTLVLHGQVATVMVGAYQARVNAHGLLENPSETESSLFASIRWVLDSLVDARYTARLLAIPAPSAAAEADTPTSSYAW